MTKYDYKDDQVVVIIGSGAGGGTLANELCQKGIPVVLLEAGKRQSPQTFINDEWASFGQLAWLDKRTTSGSWRVAWMKQQGNAGIYKRSIVNPRCKGPVMLALPTLCDHGPNTRCM